MEDLVCGWLRQKFSFRSYGNVLEWSDLWIICCESGQNWSFFIVVPPSTWSHDMMPSDFFQNAFYYRSLVHCPRCKALELFLGSFWEWFTALSTWTLSIFCLIDFVPLKNSLHFSVQRRSGELNLGGFVSFSTMTKTVWDFVIFSSIIWAK